MDIHLDDIDKAILEICSDSNRFRGPTYREIANELGYATKGAISNRMKRLREFGCLNQENVTISSEPEVNNEGESE